MQNVKELKVEDMQNINGGGIANCILGVAGGSISAGLYGGFKGMTLGGPWGAGLLGGAAALGGGFTAASVLC